MMGVDRKLKLVSGGLIGLAIIVFYPSIGAIIMREPSFPFHDGLLLTFASRRLLLLSLVFVIGYLGARGLALMNRSEEEKARYLQFTVPYIRAWRATTSRRWIIGLFAFSAGLKIVSDLASLALRDTNHFPVVLHVSVTSGHGTNVLSIISTLTESMEALLERGFFPNIDLRGGLASGSVLGLVVLIVLPYVSRRLSDCVHESEYGEQARYVKTLIPLAWMLVAVTFASLLATRHYVSRVLTHGFPHGAVSLHVVALSMLCVSLSNFFSSLLECFVVALLVTGLFASLRRNARGDTVTRESFLVDSIRGFRVMAGVCLIKWLAQEIVAVIVVMFIGLQALHHLSIDAMCIWLIPAAGMLSLVLLLLCLAPCAAASGEGSALECARRSIRIWFTRGSGVWRFVVFGFALLTVPECVSESLLLTYGAGRPLDVAMWMLSDLIAVAMSIYVTVAVWEFYEQTKKILQIASDVAEIG
jgi:hypothetical protein